MKGRKFLVSAIVSAVLLTGGAITASAMSAPTDQESSKFGTYDSLNAQIRHEWSQLSDKKREDYINKPNTAPKSKFPFGIDVDARAPKGYPDCASADFPASYAPTAPMSPFCDVELPW